MEKKESEEMWAEAFVSYGFEASVGRLFRGIIHNLNGVGQAFSMQSELLLMMFSQVDKVIDEIDRAGDFDEVSESCRKLKELLGRRASMVARLPGEVEVLQQTMRRVSLTMEDVRNPSGVNVYELGSAIGTEVDFLNSDSFFKHKVSKELALADNIPPLESHRVEIHQIIAVLLENASQALQEDIDSLHPPQLTISTKKTANSIEVIITDNADGIDTADLGKIFEPFYTTRENHLGLGLSLARFMAERFQGGIYCESVPGQTSFTLKIPLKVAAVEC